MLLYPRPSSSTQLTVINNWRIFGFYKELVEEGILEAHTKCFQNNDELIIEMASLSLEEQQRVLHNIESFLKTHSPRTLTPNILRIEVSAPRIPFPFHSVLYLRCKSLLRIGIPPQSGTKSHKEQ